MAKNLSTDTIFISKLTDIILKHLADENFGVKELAKESGLSPSGLNRRLRKTTDKNINQFIREIRLKKALEMLQNEDMTASEVAYRVGFSSPAYFNTCFSEFFGYSPGKAKQIKVETENSDNIIPAAPAPGEKELARNVLIRILPLVILLTAIIAVSVILVYPKMFKRDILADLRSSHTRITVAVLPFRNMTNDSSFNFMQNWIQEIIISDLTNYEELEVRQAESIRGLIRRSGYLNHASITPDIARTLSRKVDADVFIIGNIKLAGSALLLTTQLIDSKTRDIIKSFHNEGSWRADNISSIIDPITETLKNSLILTELKADNKHYRFLPTTSYPEAYNDFIYGDNEFFKRDFEAASEWFTQAIKIDSDFVGAIAKLSYAYYNQRKYEESKTWCKKAIEKKNLASIQQKIYIDLLNATIYDPPEMEIKYAKQLLKLDDQLPTMYYRIGIGYNQLFQYNKAIPEFERSIEINRRWGLKPDWILTYIHLGIAYHKTGQFRKEKRLYRKAERDFPDDPAPVLAREAILSFSTGDTLKAERYISKYQSVLRGSLVSEPDIATGIASIYSEAGVLDKAEKYYKQALSLEQSNPVRLNNLAYFLVDKGFNLNEGLALSEKALKLDPDNYISLHCKGWCLYKQNKPAEALEFLEKSWELKPAYFHNIDLHLQEVRNALGR